MERVGWLTQSIALVMAFAIREDKCIRDQLGEEQIKRFAHDVVEYNDQLDPDDPSSVQLHAFIHDQLIPSLTPPHKS